MQGVDISNIELVIQWRYVASIATLTQRVGRGARGHDQNARGIYLVEPKYFDGHTKKVSSGRVSGTKRKRKAVASQVSKRRKSGLLALEHAESESENSDADADGDDDELEVGDVEMGKEEEAGVTGDGGIAAEGGGAAQEDSAAVRGGLLVAVQDKGSLPQAENPLPKRGMIPNDEYEFAAMDAFINAKVRGFCRRIVLDEYFDNKGEFGFAYRSASQTNIP